MKFKDDTPDNTVKKIKNILKKINITTEEKYHFNSIENFHSIHLVIKGVESIYTNGKGTTYNYALASSYAEFMERLQNNFLHKKFALSPRVEKYKGFYFSPDEKYIDVNYFKKNESEWINTVIDPKEKLFANEILNNFSRIKYNSENTLTAIPYYNSEKECVSYLPSSIVDLVYGSNGMCAGNTPEEALVQGISEIFERHSMRQIILKKINPPTIPDEFLSKFPQIYKMMKSVKSFGYNIIVKDCSLMKEIPVIGILFINENKKTYKWNFGAHPNFEIAIERTLTEFLQGKTIENINMINLDTSNSYDAAYNFLRVFEFGGFGHFPLEVFSDNYSYSFKEYDYLNEQDYSNKKLLKHLISLLIKNNYNLLIRDVSYLGFPSFHVIIPGMSEYFQLTKKYIDTQIEYQKIRANLIKLPNISNNELINIKQYLNNYQKRYKTLAMLLNLPIKETFPWNLVNKYLFDFCVNYKLGKINEAYKSINKYTAQTKHNEYFSCSKDYFGCRTNNLKANTIKEILVKFYSEEIVNKVINDFKNPKDVFRYFGNINCWDCDNCSFMEHCSNKELEKIILNIKDYYYHNYNPNQKSVKQFLN